MIGDLDVAQSTIGLIAGNGVLPLSFVLEAQRQGRKVVVAAHCGETSSLIEKAVTNLIWVKVGQLNRIISFFKKEKVDKVAFLGGINRVRLFGGVALDRRSIKLLAKIRSFRDDALLRAIAGEFIGEGWEVISPFAILTECLAVEGFLTKKVKLSVGDLADAKLGWQVASELGRLDIGQAVVVAKGLIIGVEAIEGTDNLLLRVASLLPKDYGTVVKLAKPQQDLRLDLPTVGVKTILNMSRSNCRNLIIQAGKTCLIEPIAVAREAERLGIRIIAYSEASQIN
jgi:UDP-2,3-diacylglucosamine hydrolase